MKLDAKAMLEQAKTASISILDDLVETDPGDGDHVVPGELRRFLANLRLLTGVPFSYLVPDADLLPPESIRFFYLDRNWTDALVQGALSVGTVTTTDRAQLETVYPTLRDEVDETERTIRTPLGEDRLADAGGTITGFLLRSRAVSGWPNLHVRAYRVDVLPDDALSTVAESDPNRMKVLRMERLAPAVLLVLIDGVPEVVHIEEPRQGIQFGARMDTDAPPQARTAEVHLRDVTTGLPLEPETSVPVPFRADAPGVIDLGRLRDRMAQVAATKMTTPTPPTHEVALQLLRFPYRQVFGDPEDREAVKFFDLDTFHVTTSLQQWEVELTAQVDAHRDRGNQP